MGLNFGKHTLRYMQPVLSVLSSAPLHQVTVVNADVADLQRGKHLSHLGANLAVFDLFDEGESQ